MSIVHTIFTAALVELLDSPTHASFKTGTLPLHCLVVTSLVKGRLTFQS